MSSPHGCVADGTHRGLTPPQVQIGQSPVYVVDKRLGKGGFGQVYLGKRLPRRTSARDTKPQQVAIKFEHVSSKGCHNGPPPEWAVYKYAESL